MMCCEGGLTQPVSDSLPQTKKFAKQGSFRSIVVFSRVSTECHSSCSRHHLPLGVGLPDDIANPVLFLASQDAAYITG